MRRRRVDALALGGLLRKASADGGDVVEPIGCRQISVGENERLDADTRGSVLSRLHGVCEAIRVLGRVGEGDAMADVLAEGHPVETSSGVVYLDDSAGLGGNVAAGHGAKRKSPRRGIALVALLTLNPLDSLRAGVALGSLRAG